jgi:hypothetical protein
MMIDQFLAFIAIEGFLAACDQMLVCHASFARKV